MRVCPGTSTFKMLSADPKVYLGLRKAITKPGSELDSRHSARGSSLSTCPFVLPVHSLTLPKPSQNSTGHLSNRAALEAGDFSWQQEKSMWEKAVASGCDDYFRVTYCSFLMNTQAGLSFPWGSVLVGAIRQIPAFQDIIRSVPRLWRVPMSRFTI